MASRSHRSSRLLASLVAVVSLVGCGSDGLVPDNTFDDNDNDNETPNTDTRTVDPPTLSNLPITQP
jgi:predicted small lipoprotein YifL